MEKYTYSVCDYTNTICIFSMYRNCKALLKAECMWLIVCPINGLTATFKTLWGENSSMIMILLHASLVCLSTGSQHFSYMTQGGSYLGTAKYVFFELRWGEKNNLKTCSSPVVMLPFAFFIIVLPCCTASSSLFFFFTRLFYFYFLTTFLPVAGLQPFRPVTSNCCSSAASPALASGGCSQHRISFNLKRAISQQRACREEFNKSRYAHVRASTHISVFCINTSRIINSLTVLCPQDLLNDWESQRSVVEELNKTGSELESVIIDITAPQTKTGKQKHKDIHSIIAIKLKSLTLTSLFYC